MQPNLCARAPTCIEHTSPPLCWCLPWRWIPRSEWTSPVRVLYQHGCPPPCAHACGNPRQRGGGGGCCWGLAEALELELHYRADQELAAAVELEELRQMNGNPQLEEARCVCQWQNPNPLLKLVFE